MSEDPSAILGSEIVSNGGTILAADYSFASFQDEHRGCSSCCGVCEECEWYMMSPMPSPTFGTFATDEQEKTTSSRLGWNMERGGVVAPAFWPEGEERNSATSGHISSEGAFPGADSGGIYQACAPHALHEFQQDTLKVLSTALQVREITRNPDVRDGFNGLGFSPGLCKLKISPHRASTSHSDGEERHPLSPAPKCGNLDMLSGGQSCKDVHSHDVACHISSEPWLSRTPLSPCSQSSDSILTQSRDTSFASIPPRCTVRSG